MNYSGRCMVDLPALVALILLACAPGSAQASPDNNKKTFRFPTTVPAPANNKVNPQRVRLVKCSFLTRASQAPIGLVAPPVTIRPWDGQTATDRDRQWHDCSEALHAIHRQYRF